MPPINHDITDALQRFDKNDERSRNQLFKLVYPELELSAKRILMKFPKIGTLSPPDVVAELYTKLLRRDDLSFLANRTEFYRYTYRIMLNHILDHARLKHFKVRFEAYDEYLSRLGFEEAFEDEEMQWLLKCIDELADSGDPANARMAAVASRRIFESCQRKELAEEFGVHVRTITRDWNEFVQYWQMFRSNLNSIRS